MRLALQIVSTLVGSVSLLTAVVVILLNWRCLIRNVRHGARHSFVLLIGPLFAFLGIGLLAHGWAVIDGTWVLAVTLAAGILDPMALPLLVFGLCRWFRGRGRRP